MLLLVGKAIKHENGVFSSSYRQLLFLIVSANAALVLMYEKEDDVSLCRGNRAREDGGYLCLPFVCPGVSLQTTSLSNSIKQGQGRLHLLMGTSSCMSD